MRAYVFTDAALGRQAGRFVWLSIDTEKAANAGFKTRFPVNALPTYLVLDPSAEKVAVRWVGGATVAQLLKLFDDAVRSLAAPAKGLEAELARADRLYGEARWAEAASEYDKLLARAGKGWKPRTRAAEALVFALYSARDYQTCATRALAFYPGVRGSTSAASIAGTGLGCALEVPAENPGRAETVTKLEAATREILANPDVEMAADDRSGLFSTLVDARKEAGDAAGAKEAAAKWAAYLEREAAKARTPEARAVFDSHRLGAYLALGEPERAVPMLEASERELPDDYNPPARLAAAYRAMKRWDEALSASDRALGKAYGPRRLGILGTRAEIFAGRGDAAAARRTVEEALAFAEALPEGQRSEATIASLKKRLAAMP